MSNRKQNTVCYLLSISFILMSFVLCAELLCFNTKYMNFIQNHITLFDKSITEYIGIDNDELIKLDEATLNIIQGKKYDEDILNKYMHDYEIMHLIDCNGLNNKALLIGGISLVIFIISLIIFIKNKVSVYLLFKDYKYTLLIFGLIVIFVVFFALIDFYSFWQTFHHIVFPGNDRWLLSYRTDILLMMVPQEFFEVLVGSILALFVSICIIMWIILNSLRKKIYD